MARRALLCALIRLGSRLIVNDLGEGDMLWGSSEPSQRDLQYEERQKMKPRGQ